MEIVGYHSRIKITQVLPCVNDDIIRDPEEKSARIMRTSWLYDTGISKIIDLLGYRPINRRRLRRRFKNMNPKKIGTKEAQW